MAAAQMVTTKLLEMQAAKEAERRQKREQRMAERQRQLLLTTIGSSASSRQTVAGRPGIGKTTLVQTVKADAQTEGYWSSDEIIPINAEGASEHLLGQLLSGVYDAVLANCPTAAGPEVEAGQQLVRSIRLRGGGFTVSAFGFGAGGSQSESVATPPGALLLDGPRVLRDLLRYAIGQGARGIVLHLNNSACWPGRRWMRQRSRPRPSWWSFGS